MVRAQKPILGIFQNFQKKVGRIFGWAGAGSWNQSLVWRGYVFNTRNKFETRNGYSEAEVEFFTFKTPESTFQLENSTESCA